MNFTSFIRKLQSFAVIEVGQLLFCFSLFGTCTYSADPQAQYKSTIVVSCNKWDIFIYAKEGGESERVGPRPTHLGCYCICQTYGNSPDSLKAIHSWTHRASGTHMKAGWVNNPQVAQQL